MMALCKHVLSFLVNFINILAFLLNYYYNMIT